MRPPGGRTPAPPVRTGTTNRRETEAETACPTTVEDALRAAGRYCDAYGVNIGHSKRTRLVREYLRTRVVGQSFEDWIYPDPTGETAAWNLDHGRAAA